METVISRCERAIVTDISCPLCGIKFTLQTLEKHLGLHLQKVALFALPRSSGGSSESKSMPVGKSTTVSNSAAVGSSKRARREFYSYSSGGVGNLSSFPDFGSDSEGLGPGVGHPPKWHFHPLRPPRPCSPPWNGYRVDQQAHKSNPSGLASGNQSNLSQTTLKGLVGGGNSSSTSVAAPFRDLIGTSNFFRRE